MPQRCVCNGSNSAVDRQRETLRDAAATLTGKLNASTSTGVLRNPPPMPKKLEMNPSTTLKPVAKAR